MSTLGDKLRSLREDENLKQIELVEKFKNHNFNITSAAISQYESNKRVPDTEMLAMYADLFDVSLDWIYGRTNLKNPYIPQKYEEKHGVTNKELKEYEDFMGEANIFFMNDEVSEDDKEALFRDISELFWKSKEMNKEKYGRKKNKKE